MLYRIYDLNSNSLASVRIIITLTAGTPPSTQNSYIIT